MLIVGHKVLRVANPDRVPGGFPFSILVMVPSFAANVAAFGMVLVSLLSCCTRMKSLTMLGPRVATPPEWNAFSVSCVARSPRACVAMIPHVGSYIVVLPIGRKTNTVLTQSLPVLTLQRRTNHHGSVLIRSAHGSRYLRGNYRALLVGYSANDCVLRQCSVKHVLLLTRADVRHCSYHSLER